MSDDAERTVASGFPDPDTVPSPTERLRKLHGESGEQPEEPKLGRSRKGSAAKGDVGSLQETIAGSGGGAADAAGGAIATIARSIGEQAARHAIEDFARHGYLGRLQTAGAGAGQIGAAALLGACAAGAFTAGVVMLWSRVLPRPLAAFATAATLGGAAVPLIMSGSSQIREGVTGDL